MHASQPIFLLYSLYHVSFLIISDYIEAATAAYDAGLIHKEGMQHIGYKVVDEFETLRLRSPFARETKRRSMNNSIEGVNVKLNQCNLPSIPFVPSICMYEVGAVVSAPILISLYMSSAATT